MLTVGHHRETDDLEHNSDDRKTEVVEVKEMNETGKKNGRGQTKTGVVGGQKISIRGEDTNTAETRCTVERSEDIHTWRRHGDR